MQRMFKVAKRGMGGVGNVINTLTTAAVDMVKSAEDCHIRNKKTLQINLANGILTKCVLSLFPLSSGILTRYTDC